MLKLIVSFVSRVNNLTHPLLSVQHVPLVNTNTKTIKHPLLARNAVQDVMLLRHRKSASIATVEVFNHWPHRPPTGAPKHNLVTFLFLLRYNLLLVPKDMQHPINTNPAKSAPMVCIKKFLQPLHTVVNHALQDTLRHRVLLIANSALQEKNSLPIHSLSTQKRRVCRVLLE